MDTRRCILIIIGFRFGILPAVLTSMEPALKTPPFNFTNPLLKLNSEVHSSNHQAESIVERINATSKWPLNQALPVVGQTLSRCNLRLVTWANHSLNKLILLDHIHAAHWFATSSRKRRASSMDTTKLESHKRQLFSKTSNLDCHFLFIYSTKCPFSVAAFPFMKALARAFPQFFFHAVKVEDYVANRWSLRMLYVPKLKLIVDGRILREYPGSDTDLDALVDFVWVNTRQIPKGPIDLRSEDYDDNPPMPTAENTVLLIISWLTVITSTIYLLFVFGPTVVSHFSILLYRLSCGHFGKAPQGNSPGTILTWDPNHLSPRDR